MKSDNYAVVLVYSTSYALRVEKILKATGVETKLIPVPRHLSSDCGICVRIPITAKEQVQKILDSKKIEYEGVYSY